MRARVQTDFASAAERHALRRGHHRPRRILDRHVGALELPHRQVNVVPLAFLRGHQQQHQVRARRKIRAPGWRSPWLRIRFPAARRPPGASRRCRRRSRSSWSGIRSTARRRRGRSGSRPEFSCTTRVRSFSDFRMMIPCRLLHGLRRAGAKIEIARRSFFDS